MSLCTRVSYRYYREASSRLFEAMRSHPAVKVCEKGSLDEAWLDVSQHVHDDAQKRGHSTTALRVRHYQGTCHHVRALASQVVSTSCARLRKRRRDPFGRQSPPLPDSRAGTVAAHQTVRATRVPSPASR